MEEQPGLVLQHAGMSMLIVWVGTTAESEAHGKVHDTLFRDGYYVTGWRHATDPAKHVTAVGLINRASFETETEREAVCRHIMAIVDKALAGEDRINQAAPPAVPPELKRLVQGRDRAEYTVLVACGKQVLEAEFIQNEHGWYCDRIGWEFRWEYPVPDGGPHRDGPQEPSPSPKEAALKLLRLRRCGDLYFKILLDDFPPLLV